MSILQGAFGKDDPEDDPKTCSSLGAVVLAANPLSPSAIAALLGFRSTDVFLRLLSVHSLLILQDINHPVRPFHKSFPDFIIDPARCINPRFYISPPNHHLELLLGCLELMNQTLERNMCDLPEAVKNSDIGDLEERREQYISHALQYACKSWHKHLIYGYTTHIPRITSALHHFLEKKFLYWLEVLSVFGAVRDAVDALGVAVKWLEESPTLDLTNDCIQFVIGFFDIINLSAPHIYHSALLLSPQKSIVQKLYGSQANPLVRVVHGAQASWDPSITIKGVTHEVVTVVWSPCSRFIAVSQSVDGTITVLDAATLEQLHTFSLEYYPTWDGFMFSPDSHLLMGFSNEFHCIVSWDLQTGGLINDLDIEEDELYDVTFSGCGTMFGTLDEYNTITIYNILSGTQISSHSFQKLHIIAIWTYGEYLHFASIGQGFMTIWEVSFTSTNASKQISSLPLPDNFSFEYPVLLPTLFWLAFIHERRLIVLDVQHQKVLLDTIDVEIPGNVSFSSDGQFFSYKNMHSCCVLKKSPDGYLPYQNFVTKETEAFVSPDGELIVSFCGTIVQLWHTRNSPTISSSTSLQVYQHTKYFLLEFSPNGSLVAIAQQLDSRVTILDVRSGNPQLVIDTGAEICGIGITESRVIVVGDGKITTWELPSGDCVLDAQGDIKNGVVVTTFNAPAPIQKLHASISPDLNYVAFCGECILSIYDMYTGEKLAVGKTEFRELPGFTPGGDEVWCATSSKGVDQPEAYVTKYTIDRGGGSNTIRLVELGTSTYPLTSFPWRSSCGYKVTKHGWVLSPSGKLLLWIPRWWRLEELGWKWSGRFLALLYGGLPEAVILELEV